MATLLCFIKLLCKVSTSYVKVHQKQFKNTYLKIIERTFNIRAFVILLLLINLNLDYPLMFLNDKFYLRAIIAKNDSKF